MDVIIMHLKHFYLRNNFFFLIDKGKQIWEDKGLRVIEGGIYLTSWILEIFSAGVYIWTFHYTLSLWSVAKNGDVSAAIDLTL